MADRFPARTMEKVAAAARSPSPDRTLRTDDGSTMLRRFRGPLADELYFLCRPRELGADAASQFESAYEALLDTLSSEGVGCDSIVTETVFLRNIREDYSLVRDARRRTIGRAGLFSPDAATTFVGQTPLGDEARVVIAASAIAPHRSLALSTLEVTRPPSCPCEACRSEAQAKAIRFGEALHLHAGNVFGRGRTAFDEAFDLFCQAESLLAEAGMTFRDVARTWIHLRDVDRDYHALNQARREFFRSRGIERRPASTGVEGIPCSDAHDFSLSFFAVKSPGAPEAPPMSTPTLNEAWTYGADFSRGLKLDDANKTSLLVSGTASIDENGRSVFPGDLEGQADRMLRNVASLLEGQGADFRHVVSAVTYLKRPADAAVLREMFRQRGFTGFPCAIVEARLCRPELLCETEALAILPTAGAA